jgi:tetratricopeptide (TPR) repeat protein
VRGLLAALAFLSTLGGAVAQTAPPGAPTPGNSTAIAHRVVSTSNAAAQRDFDEGLTLLYAFNPEEARVRFQHAASLDPALAAARWGVAMSWGININTDFDPAGQREGREAIATALRLAGKASPVERALIGAAIHRFAFDRKADADRSARAYADAMQHVAREFPTDDDVQALAAEASLDIAPWSYWNADGRPMPGIEPIIAQLQSVLTRDPNHIQANHLLIHALEESPHPEGALAAADRLNADVFEPGAEHLAHMPAHTYMAVGDYHAAGVANTRALDLFDAYLGPEHATGHETYRPHDCTFAVDAYMMSGEHAAAQREATRCERSSLALASEVAIRFGRWAELAAMKTDLHFAHGMSAALAGRPIEAEADAHALETQPSDNDRIAGAVLRGRIARGRGDRPSELAALVRAVQIQDAQGYSEPPSFFYPVRETLGGAYLRAARYEDAERTFRADLVKHPRNPRSLLGLSGALASEGKAAEAQRMQDAFAQAWRWADGALDINQL